MHRFTLFHRLSLAYLLLPTTLLADGGWLPGKRQGTFWLDQQIMVTSRFFGPDGQLVRIPNTQVFITRLRAEYGLSARLAVVRSAPLFFRTAVSTQMYGPDGYTTSRDVLNAFGDLDLGLKYALIKDRPFVLSAGLVLGVPTGNTNGGNTGMLRSGDGEFNQMLQLEAGHQAPGSPVRTSVMAGFNHRTRGFSHELHFRLESTRCFGGKWAAGAGFEAVRSLLNGDAPEVSGTLFSNNVSYMSAGPTLLFQASKNLMFTGTARFVFAAKNTLASPLAAFGLAYQFARRGKKP